MSSSLLAALVRAVGRQDVLTDASDLAGYEVDWTGRFRGHAGAVVRPRDTDGVAATLAACHAEGQAVVLVGGGTGLVGGSIPQDGELVVDLRGLDTLQQVDPVAGQVTVGAGATLQAVQDHVAEEGLELPVDLAARSGATIGGMVATNAAGALAARYGAMRAHVAGLEAVLADGRVMRRLSGLLKDTAGYDLPATLVGTEGTLAAITQVRLRLTRRPARRVSALLGLPDMEAAVALAVTLRDRLGPALEAADAFDEAAMALACARLRAPDPLGRPHPVYAIVEVADDDDPLELLGQALGEQGAVAVAEGAARRRDLWRFREVLNEAVGAEGVAHKLDVSIPLGALAGFVDELRVVVADVADAARLVLWGHLADGNVHVNVLGLDPEDERLDELVLRLVADCQGSISAEHGVGLAKRRWLHLTRGQVEIDAMYAIKDALDPRGILAPGRVLPPRTPDRVTSRLVQWAPGSCDGPPARPPPAAA